MSHSGFATLLAPLVVIVLFAGCQTKTIDSAYKQSIEISEADPIQHEGQVLHLDPADVQARAPALAKAMDEAKARRSAFIRGQADVETTWEYLDQVRGQEARTPTTVESRGDYFMVIGVAS